MLGEGPCGEYVWVPDAFVARKPESLSFEQAAAIPLAALTAYQALFLTAGLTAGERVLVSAAAGGVGSFAVQLAIDAGAEVIGVASEQHRERVLELGAYEVFDRTRDVVGGHTGARARQCLEKRGIRPLRRRAARRRRARRGPPRLDRGAALVRRARRRSESLVSSAPTANSSRSSPRWPTMHHCSVRSIAEVLPLEDAARAHKLSEGGHVRGKLVLRVD